MSGQALSRIGCAPALVLALVAIPATSLTGAPAQCLPPLLSLAGFYSPLPGVAPDSARDLGAPAAPLTNTQRWYISFLTQQRVIAAQVEELRSRFTQNLIGPDEFLETLDPLLQRAERLYAQWKRIGAGKTGRFPAAESRRAARGVGSVVLPRKDSAESAPSFPDREHRDDAAVGRCLNYLRLSLANLFLGYADWDGFQIADADRQADLSELWRSRSMSFINAMEPVPAGPEF